MTTDSRRKNRYTLKHWILALLVTAAWLSVMFFVWQREGTRRSDSLKSLGLTPEEILVTWRDYYHLMLIEHKGREIGASSLQVQMLRDTIVTKSGKQSEIALGYDLETRLLANYPFSMKLIPISVPIEVDALARLNTGFELQTLQAKLSIAGQRIECDSFVEGTRLYYDLRVNQPLDEDATTTATAPNTPLPLPAGNMLSQLLAPGRTVGALLLEEPIVLSSILDPLITSRSDRMEVGRRWSTQAYSPLLGAGASRIEGEIEAREEIVINEETIDTWRMHERSGEYETISWYDMNGRLVKSKLPGELTLTQTNGAILRDRIPGFLNNPIYRPLDRTWIKNNQQAEYRDQKLEDALQLPQILP